MKALLFVLIWSSTRPLMTSSTVLMPDLAACNKAAVDIQRVTNEAGVMGGNIVTRCTSIEPEK